MRNKRPFFSTSLLTLIGRSGGFIIPFVVAGLYGATPATDIFFFSFSVIILVISLFTHIFESTLLPFLAVEPKNVKDISRRVNTVLIWTLPLAWGIGWLLPEILAYVLAHWGGWSPESARRVAKALHEMRFFLIGAVAAAGAQAVLYSLKSFWMPAVSPLLRSAVVIAFAYFFRGSLQVRALTWGFGAGEALRAVLTFIVLCRESAWSREWKLTMPQGGEFLKQAAPQLLALAAVNLLFLSDQWFASQVSAGSLSLLNYADRILQIPYILFISAFLQIFLSDWSDTYQADPQFHFWPKVHRDIRAVFSVCSAAGILFWIFRNPIAGFLYSRSRLSQTELQMIADLFGWLSLGFIPGVVRLLCGRVLFVMKRSSVYCLQSWAELLMNIVLNTIFVRYFGLIGIAMATAAVYNVSTVITYAYIRKKAKGISLG